MPLLNPGVQNALRIAGLSRTEILTGKEESDISSRLNRNNLSLDDAIGHLVDIVQGADSSAVKLRAVQDIFKLHGVMKEQPQQLTAVNININDPGSNSKDQGTVNPILIPRTVTVE